MVWLKWMFYACDAGSFLLYLHVIYCENKCIFIRRWRSLRIKYVLKHVRETGDERKKEHCVNKMNAKTLVHRWKNRLNSCIYWIDGNKVRSIKQNNDIVLFERSENCMRRCIMYHIYVDSTTWRDYTRSEQNCETQVGGRKSWNCISFGFCVQLKVTWPDLLK